MIASNTISAQYHYHADEGEPAIEAELGKAAGLGPYVVLDIGPFTIYNLTSEQLRKVAIACDKAAEDLDAENHRREEKLAREIANDPVAESGTAAE